MKNALFDRRHLKEYALYGLLAGLLYSIMAWYFLHKSTYSNSAFLYIGSILFLLVIMFYTIRLTHRRPFYKSTGLMLVAGHIAIIVGVLVSSICALILCFIYIPGFLSNESPDSFLNNAPLGFNNNNEGTLVILFLTATLANFLASSFICTVVSYVIKPNQTKDKTPGILDEPAPPQAENPSF